MKKITALDTIIEQYDAVFCDVWGVIHNGVDNFPKALQALKKLRESSKTVLLLTNSPRQYTSVHTQLLSVGVGSEFYDYVVTSGDATRQLIEQAPRKIFHLGPERDLNVFEGLDIELVEEFEADCVVCTGFYQDETSITEEYMEILRRLRARNLPLICANPDISAHRGNIEICCAGALAREYSLLGGRTLIAGKPHRPIYELALNLLNKDREKQNLPHIEKNKILAIGDGLLTDIKGAEQFGLDVLYIAGGIHHAHYSENTQLDEKKMQDFVAQYGSNPLAYMWALQ